MNAIIIVPCYNEAARMSIGAFRAFAVESREPRFLFVDDGSTDGTAALIAPLVVDDPKRFHLLRLEVNAGKAEAVRRGMLLALEGNPEVVGFLDADLSIPLSQLHLLLEVLAQRPFVQVVMGSRVRMLGRDIRQPLGRYCLSRAAATLISWTLHLGTHDTQCDAKLFRVTPVVKAIWAEPFLSRWLFDVEILFRFLNVFSRGPEREKAKDALYEVPLVALREVRGSKIHARHYMRALWDLYSLWRRYRH